MVSDGFRPTVGVRGWIVRIPFASRARWSARSMAETKVGGTAAGGRGGEGVANAEASGVRSRRRASPARGAGRRRARARASGTGTGTGVRARGRPRRIEAARTRFGRSLGPPARLRGFDGAATPPPRACEAPRSRGRVSRGACGRSRRPTPPRTRGGNLARSGDRASDAGARFERRTPETRPRATRRRSPRRRPRGTRRRGMPWRVDARRPSGARA